MRERSYSRKGEVSKGKGISEEREEELQERTGRP